MARSESDSDDEPLESLAQLKEKVHGLNKAKLEELLFTSMDECDVRKLEHIQVRSLKVKDLKWMKRLLFCMKTLISLKKP